MPNVNIVVLAGNLVRDPESNYLPSGTAVTKLTLAINRKYKDKTGEAKEEVTYVPVEAWGKTAELAMQYLKKGQPLLVEGALKLDQWTEKDTGNKRSMLKVSASRLQFLGGPKQDAVPKSAPAATPPARPAAPAPAQENLPEEANIPF